jgi:hypothetical protein
MTWTDDSRLGIGVSAAQRLHCYQQGKDGHPEQHRDGMQRHPQPACWIELPVNPSALERGTGIAPGWQFDVMVWVLLNFALNSHEEQRRRLAARHQANTKQTNSTTLAVDKPLTVAAAIAYMRGSDRAILQHSIGQRRAASGERPAASGQR